jgi:trimethylamine--corrinoid protein Co-methyltransferase
MGASLPQTTVAIIHSGAETTQIVQALRRKMIPRYGILSQDEIESIHQATIKLLSEVGVRVYHHEVLELLADAGAIVDAQSQIVKIGEVLLMESLGKTGKSYILYGRDGTRSARLGYGDVVTISSPGQYSWVDPIRRVRRPPISADTRQAIWVGDALEHIDIVGAMTQPVDIPTPIRDIWLTAELVKGTKKPTRCWIANGQTARYILEIYKTIAGGESELRAHPQIEAFIEPISPLQMPTTGMEILLEFTRLGLPISFGPMVQAGATGPVTLAGTLVQENAETLAAIVITQVLQPGTAVMYGGIPHTMDMRTASISFGSPEQGLMAVAITQIARWYGLPVYINVGLSDSKLVDGQSGVERGITFLLGALAGGDLLGHMGISGADQGASLPQLAVDNEMIAYVKRVLRGFKVEEKTMALNLMKEVSHQGSHLAQTHTLDYFRTELWIPTLFDRRPWDVWADDGGKSVAERAAEKIQNILDSHAPEPMDEALAREVDSIVESARKHLL